MEEKDVNTAVLSSKLAHLEDRFNSYAERVEQKLDELVQLVKIVAVLQERETAFERGLNELRMEVRSGPEHLRESLDKKIEKHVEDSSVADSNIYKKIDSLRARLEAIDEEVKKWLNRVTGGVIVGAALLSLVQFLGYSYIQNLTTRYEEVALSNQEVQNRLQKLEEALYFLNKSKGK
jgi:hypothetical protein